MLVAHIRSICFPKHYLMAILCLTIHLVRFLVVLTLLCLIVSSDFSLHSLSIPQAVTIRINHRSYRSLAAM